MAVKSYRILSPQVNQIKNYATLHANSSLEAKISFILKLFIKITITSQEDNPVQPLFLPF